MDPVNYVHIKETSTPKQIWEDLQKAFEDTGLTRKVSLITKLTTTKLKDCATVDEYVNTIISTANQMRGINFDVPDEWVGALLLAGLPEEYKPMFMALESFGTTIGADSMKTKILQEVKYKNASIALYTKLRVPKNKVKGPRCYNCGGHGHFASSCANSERRDQPKKGIKGSTSGQQSNKTEKNKTEKPKNDKSREKKSFCEFFTSNKFSSAP